MGAPANFVICHTLLSEKLPLEHGGPVAYSVLSPFSMFVFVSILYVMPVSDTAQTVLQLSAFTGRFLIFSPLCGPKTLEGVRLFKK
jgi:hypothetical protein